MWQNTVHGPKLFKREGIMFYRVVTLTLLLILSTSGSLQSSRKGEGGVDEKGRRLAVIRLGYRPQLPSVEEQTHAGNMLPEDRSIQDFKSGVEEYNESVREMLGIPSPRTSSESVPAKNTSSAGGSILRFGSSMVEWGEEEEDEGESSGVARSSSSVSFSSTVSVHDIPDKDSTPIIEERGYYDYSLEDIENLFQQSVACRNSDPTQSLALLDQAARLGHPAALTGMGMQLEQESVDRAFNCYVRAARIGHVPAMYNAGISLYSRASAEDNPDALFKGAFAYFSCAVERNDVEAMYYKGIMCNRGLGTERNYRLAGNLFQQSYQKGVMRSAIELAIMHLRGWGGMKKNIETAVELLQQERDASDYHGSSALLLALFDENKGKRANISVVRELLRHAKSRGNYLAVFHLGLSGDKCELFSSSAESLQSLRTTAKKSGYCKAFRDLGHYYKFGQTGFVRSEEHAKFWHHKAMLLQTYGLQNARWGCIGREPR